MTEEMKTATVALTVGANVYCPHCDAYIDLYNDEFNVEAVESSEYNKEVEADYGTASLILGVSYKITCPICSKDFVVDDYNIEETL